VICKEFCGNEGKEALSSAEDFRVLLSLVKNKRGCPEMGSVPADSPLQSPRFSTGSVVKEKTEEESFTWFVCGSAQAACRGG
jgi:hypothetical protein